MTVGQLSPPLSGDFKATKAEATTGAEAPPSRRSPLPESRVGRGSRFWALAGESSDEEEEESQAPATQVADFSPRSGPSRVTLGYFLSPAWSQVSARASTMRRKGRGSRFAPGGKCSRFGGVPAPQLNVRSGPVVRHPSPEVVGSGSVRVPGDEGSFDGGAPPAAVPSSSPATTPWSSLSCGVRC
jgi:hypothetical protein